MLVYLEYPPGANGRSFLRAWVDIDDDLNVDDAEVRPIADSLSFGMYSTSFLRRPQRPTSAYVYYNSSANTYFDSVWEPGQVWSAATGSIRVPYDFEASCRTFDYIDEHLGLCGTGQFAEVRYNGGIDSGVQVSLGVQLVATGNRIGSVGLSYASGQGRQDAALVADFNSDSSFAPSETIVRSGAAIGHYVDDAPLFVRKIGDGERVVEIERWRPRAATRFLGESCATAGDACAGSLECRVSGNALEPRCVPAAP